MKEKLYAALVTARKMTLPDVPEHYREAVTALLSERDRARQEAISNRD